MKKITQTKKITFGTFTKYIHDSKKLKKIQCKIWRREICDKKCSNLKVDVTIRQPTTSTHHNTQE